MKNTSDLSTKARKTSKNPNFERNSENSGVLPAIDGVPFSEVHPASAVMATEKKNKRKARIFHAVATNNYQNYIYRVSINLHFSMLLVVLQYIKIYIYY